MHCEFSISFFIWTFLLVCTHFTQKWMWFMQQKYADLHYCIIQCNCLNSSDLVWWTSDVKLLHWYDSRSKVWRQDTVQICIFLVSLQAVYILWKNKLTAFKRRVSDLFLCCTDSFVTLDGSISGYTSTTVWALQNCCDEDLRKETLGI